MAALVEDYHAAVEMTGFENSALTRARPVALFLRLMCRGSGQEMILPASAGRFHLHHPQERARTLP